MSEGETAPETAPAAEAAPSSSSSSSSSGSCGGCSFGEVFAPLKANPICQEIHEILLWNKIMTTLLAFVIVNFLFLLVLYAGYSFLTLFSIVMFVALIVFFLLGQGPVLIGKYVTKSEIHSPIENLKIEIPKEIIEQLAKALGDLINALLGVIKNVLLSKDLPVTISAFFLLLFSWWLGTKARLTTLIYIGILFGFIWPRLYKEQQPAIDNLFAKIQALVKEQYEKLTAAAKEKLNKPKAE